ncbi:MAG: tetratricopeptide repeat protein, partial [Candidatus Cloacimonetes bacterium]|nr:tetratricopeptide repeat protein [Candidatus Cloacimonadota bacterium]
EQMVHNNLGVIYMDNNDLSKAEQEFKKELEINPDYDKALVNLGEIYYRQERFIEAKYFWQEAFRINPYDPSPYFRLLKLDAQLNPGASASESNN